MEPFLDHIAIRVSDRDAMRDTLLDALDWTVIEQTARFTLLGADSDHGKLTLLDAEPGARPHDDPGAGRLHSIVVAAPEGTVVTAPLHLADGLAITFLEVRGDEWADTPRHAVVGVSLRASDPPIAAARFAGDHDMTIDFVQPRLAVLQINGAATHGTITLSRERWDTSAPELLDHVGIRIDDADAARVRAEQDGLEVVRWVEAPHSKAVFVGGPEQLLIEYVELTSAFAA